MMRTTMKRVIAALAAFAALAPLAVSQPAAANNDARTYIVPFIPGKGGVAGRNHSSASIRATNTTAGSANFSMKAYVDEEGELPAHSCGSISNLKPYEIRRFARHLNQLCVHGDDNRSYSLQIETVKGVHLTGFYHLREHRGLVLVPMEIVDVTEYAVPDHTHNNYAPKVHNHNNYAPTGHNHPDYSPRKHKHAPDDDKPEGNSDE